MECVWNKVTCNCLSPPLLHTPNKDKDPYHNNIAPIEADRITLGSELHPGEYGPVLRGIYKQPNGKVVCTYMYHYYIIIMAYSMVELICFILTLSLSTFLPL